MVLLNISKKFHRPDSVILAVIGKFAKVSLCYIWQPSEPCYVVQLDFTVVN